MAKSRLKPTRGAYLRRIRFATWWNVPPQRPDMTPFVAASARSSISLAARFVNVRSMISCAGMPRSIRCTTRYTSVRVLPVPAAARTNSGPSGAVAASSCSALSSFERSVIFSWRLVCSTSRAAPSYGRRARAVHRRRMGRWNRARTGKADMHRGRFSTCREPV